MNKRFLFVVTELSPYLEITEFAELLTRLIVFLGQNKIEVRCIMPCYGSINIRRHKLHEVISMSGINIHVNQEDFPLQIKVASIPNSRNQVYFMQNDDFFGKKILFHDENDQWLPNNGIRSIFFAKSVLEVVKKFNWAPEIIHVCGWFSAITPLLIKTTYSREPVFARSKIVYTIQENYFKEKLGNLFLQNLLTHQGITPKTIESYKETTNTALQKGAATYSDAITFAGDKIENSLMKNFANVKNKKILHFNGWNADLSEYLAFYQDLLQKGK